MDAGGEPGKLLTIVVKSGAGGEPPEEDKRVSAQPAFAELTAIYRRPWPDDPREERRAWEGALAAGADPAEIVEAARAWVEAADAPRFLPALAKWLDAESWRKPPPAKRAQRRSGGKPQRMTPARAMAKVRDELWQGAGQ
jgi:hypothetical protein